MDIDVSPVIIQNLGNVPFDETLRAGQGIVVAGTVLAKRISDGQLVRCGVATTDGQNIPYAIQCGDVDTTSGAATGQRPMAAGIVNGSKLVFGGADTLATHYNGLRNIGIIARDFFELQKYDN
jgi:hypothetical protein